MNSEGLFVVFEGPEGSGKTTQAQRLVEHLQQSGYPALYTREPGGTDVGEEIRNVLLKVREKPIPALTEFFLFLASRAVFIAQRVAPMLKEGNIVVADRYYLSTIAYQIAGRELPLGPGLVSNELATTGLEPNLTILLLVSWEEGKKRQRRQGKEPDRIEMAKEDFHRRVFDGYSRFSISMPNLHQINTTDLSEDEVFEQVKQTVEELLEGGEK